MPAAGGIDLAPMAPETTPPCANCQRLQAEVDSLRAELEALRAVVAQLQRQLAAARTDSSNSSKPPSSDIVKPPKPPPPGQQRRKPGGQPGHVSYSAIRKFVRDVIGLTISRGQLARIVAKLSRALEQPYEELLGDLPGQAVLNVDETGHKRAGQQYWTWCFRAGLYTLFKIDPIRSADVLIDVLGSEFDGVLGCDYFSAYRRYHREFGVVLQFCLAHLIRDVKYLTTLPDARDWAYGEGLREALRGLFAVIPRRGEWTEREFQRRLGAARDEVLLRGTSNVPTTPAATNLASRLEAHGASYFRFITEPGIGPTNNLAWRSRRSGSW
jgi:transposase